MSVIVIVGSIGGTVGVVPVVTSMARNVLHLSNYLILAVATPFILPLDVVGEIER